MNESKAMLELADRIEASTFIEIQEFNPKSENVDGWPIRTTLNQQSQELIVAALRSSAPQGDTDNDLLCPVCRITWTEMGMGEKGWTSCENGHRLPTKAWREANIRRKSAPQGDGRALEPPVWEDHDMGRAYREELSAPPSVALEAGEVTEEAESLNGHRMLTVRSDRGDEYVIDADAAVKALAQLFSDRDNEKRFGWVLNADWYEQKLSSLREAASRPALTRPQPGGAS